MFTWLNKQGVKSDKGFMVQFIARFEVKYQEDQKIISVYVEPDFTASSKLFLHIESSAFSAWSDGAPISEEKQKEILKNFTDAMEFQGIGVVVE